MSLIVQVVAPILDPVTRAKIIFVSPAGLDKYPDIPASAREAIASRQASASKSALTAAPATNQPGGVTAEVMCAGQGGSASTKASAEAPNSLRKYYDMPFNAEQHLALLKKTGW